MTSLHTFAVGDVHGRADLLATLLRAIEFQSSSRGFDYRVIFLGDIIDRGPNSRGAMDLVLETFRTRPDSALILGNHDWFPIRILDQLEESHKQRGLEHWIDNMGGDATLRSYGIDPAEVAVENLEQVFPSHHLGLLRNASGYIELDHFLLAHAGLVPGIPLGEQRAYDLMWVREPFLSSDYPFPKTVIHGHTVTPTKRPEVHAGRIGIDTGAYQTDRLCAAHISPYGAVEFISTVPGSPDAVEEITPFVGGPRELSRLEGGSGRESGLPPSIRAIQEKFRPKFEAQDRRMEALNAAASIQK